MKAGASEATLKTGGGGAGDASTRASAAGNNQDQVVAIKMENLKQQEQDPQVGNGADTTKADDNDGGSSNDKSKKGWGKNSKDKKEAKPSIPYSRLYRYAAVSDWILMFIGTIGALAVGVSQPLMSIVFGDLISSLATYPVSLSPTRDDDLRNSAHRGVTYLFAIGMTVAGAAYLMFSLWQLTGERQAKKIREEYLAAILRQEVGWFDKTPTGDLTTRMTADISTLQDGISDKAALVIQGATTFLSGFVIAFIKGPKLAGVLCCAFPLLGGASALLASTLKKRTGRGTEFYADAGAVAQEVLSSIRTVTAFGGQKRAYDRYTEKLISAEKEGTVSAITSGVSTGVVFSIIFLTYALGFWYGGSLIYKGEMDPGQVVNVFFAIIIGAFALGTVGPNLSAMGAATGAAAGIFETIDRQSAIDPLSEDGEKPAAVEGLIEFKNIDFHYPQRPDVPILKNFSLKVMPGQTVALVGASGSGKSTIVKMVERFYDPVNGTVLIDGKDIRTLNVKWLRQQIGLVGQEPVLFDKTVRENLVLGMKEGEADRLGEQEVSAKVEKCCKMANAWEFITTLPLGVDTNVGESGGMMSGGQKQRIAIARAVMRDPSILLLDEATSALDTQSERIVQAALDNASKNRTTIVVAHRLSTIKNADMIVVMGDGMIIETGTHNQLIEKGGAYAKLVETQALRESKEEEGQETADAVSPLKVKVSDIRKSAPRLASATSITSLKEPGSPTSIKDEAADAADLRAKIARRKEEEALQKAQEEAVKKRKMPWLRLWGMSRSEWYFYMLGSLGSIGSGILFPMFSLIFSSMINTFAKKGDELLDGVRFWTIMFVLLGLGAFVSNAGSISMFGIAGQRLTRRLRSKTFEALLQQEIGFFDEDKHSTGALTGRLAEDANQVQGIVGQNMATVVQTIATMTCGMILAFSHGWALTLIVLCSVPFIAVAGAMQIRVLTGFGSKSKEAYEEASVIANEVIDQIRTVLTLTKEKYFLDNYKNNIVEPHKVAVKGSFIAGIGFGVAQGFIFLSYALAFWAGSELVLARKMEAPDVLTVMFAVIFTAVAMGQASSLAPNYVKAKLAAFNILDLLDRASLINPTSEEGISKDSHQVVGKAKLVDAKFKYPARPDVPVLQGLNVEALPGQTVALVGPSGCGKSTTIALLERWYDVHSGSVRFDDTEVKDWRISNLRTHMALVGQEPVLFNQSIRENIMYGARLGTAAQEEIEAVAKKANIHDFVASLPEGYNTIVGSKGGQLSGGQKQRVAIARALIREPKLLLLDEATSALDSESEKVVQEALDAAAKGRTTIVIAHRLSTIQTADHIIVVQNGKAVEQGKYDELIKMGGHFAELVAAQSLSKTAEKN